MKLKLLFVLAFVVSAGCAEPALVAEEPFQMPWGEIQSSFALITNVTPGATVHLEASYHESCTREPDGADVLNIKIWNRTGLALDHVYWFHETGRIYHNFTWPTDPPFLGHAKTSGGCPWVSFDYGDVILNGTWSAFDWKPYTEWVYESLRIDVPLGERVATYDFEMNASVLRFAEQPCGDYDQRASQRGISRINYTQPDGVTGCTTWDSGIRLQSNQEWYYNGIPEVGPRRFTITMDAPVVVPFWYDVDLRWDRFTPAVMDLGFEFPFVNHVGRASHFDPPPHLPIEPA